MSFEDIDKLIKTMKRNGIHSVKTADIEIVGKNDSISFPRQKPPVVIPDDVQEKIKVLTTPATDEQLLFDPYFGLEENENV